MTTCWKIGMRFAKWPPKYSTRIIYANLSAFNSKVLSLELYILFQSHLVSAFSSPSTEHQQKKIVAHFWFGFIPLQVFWPLAVIIISLSPIDVASIDIKNQKFDKLFYTLDIECVCAPLRLCDNEPKISIFSPPPYCRYEREERSIRLEFIAC